MRWLRCSIALLVAFFAYSATAAAAVQHDLVTVDTSFTDSSICGFPLQVDLNGSFTVTSFTDANGTVRKVIITAYGGRFTATFTNAATGKTVTTRNQTDVVIETFDAEGNLLTHTDNGIVFLFTVPGEGVLSIDAGHLLLDSDFNVILEGGPHDIFAGDTAELCNYLATP
jgi:hypothetical protein